MPHSAAIWSRRMKRPLSHVVAEEANLHVKEVKKTIGILFEVMVRELRAGGRCTLPNIVVLVTRKKAAPKAQKKNVFGKVCVCPPRPARTIVRARVAKRLRDAIG